MRPAGDDPTEWRRAFLWLFGVTAITKVVLGWRLPLFVDEAFYWQESRQLAWTYSDLPGMTAWLIHAGESLFGHSALAMRSLFIVIALLIPWLSGLLCRRYFGTAAAWQTASWSLLLPLLASFGVLALPDVPLTLLVIVAVVVVDRLADDGRDLRFAGLLGVVLAAGWLTHYRFAMLWLAGVIFVFATSRGRAMLKKPGLWLAVGIGSVGLLPLWLSDPQMGGAALRFQLLDRHPWQFQTSALVQPIEQALVTTPVLYTLLIGVLAVAGRRWRGIGDGAPWDLLCAVAATFVVGYFALGLFADAERFRIHWPLPGYLVLVVGLPFLFAWAARPALARVLARLAVATALAGTLVVYGYFAIASLPSVAAMLSGSKAFPEHLTGWNEVADATRRLLDERNVPGIELVADNFMLAAQLDFAFDGRRAVYSLDHPLNTKHGRASQLHAWRRDEAALRELAGREVLLVVDETAGRERERPQWLATLCSRIVEPTRLEQLALYDGRRRFAWYVGRVPAAGDNRSNCSDRPG